MTDFSEGGYVTGRNDSDLIPVSPSDGYIINQATIKKLGLRNLEAFMRTLNADDRNADD
jgi:hypothetical protein